MFSSNLH